MDDVQVKRNKLRSRIHLINCRRQYYISKDAETSVNQGGALLAGQEKIKDQVDSTANDVKGVVQDIKDMHNKVTELHALMQQREMVQAKAHEDALKRDVCNQLLALLGDSHKKRSKDHKNFFIYRCNMLT